jgi:hypothetical protein
MRLYKSNPHYVEFRGKPVLLVGSGEHYGAVMNRAFDMSTYLKTVAAAGLNQVRLFSGVYRERPGSHGIEDNTLAPAESDFVCPWRKKASGKYDLESWDEAYFNRLLGFINDAGRCDVAVELVLFCFWYGADFWALSPMHPGNTVQGLGPLDHERLHRLLGNDLLLAQKRMVDKLVNETVRFDNVYYEICNEPYSRHDHSSDLEWQHHMIDVVCEAGCHQGIDPFISLNYQNRTLRIDDCHPRVGIVNFHYALPDAVKENYHLCRVIADDETGFKGQADAPYRKELWSFVIAGGGAVSHLDYSFTAAHPDGTAVVRGNTPGYGSSDLRAQLGFMRRYLESKEVWRLEPHSEIIATSEPTSVGLNVLGEAGRLYLLYLPESQQQNTLPLLLPRGGYEVRWLSPVEQRAVSEQTIDHTGSQVRLPVPAGYDDLVLEVARVLER